MLQLGVGEISDTVKETVIIYSCLFNSCCHFYRSNEELLHLCALCPPAPVRWVSEASQQRAQFSLYHPPLCYKGHTRLCGGWWSSGRCCCSYMSTAGGLALLQPTYQGWHSVWGTSWRARSWHLTRTRWGPSVGSKTLWVSDQNCMLLSDSLSLLLLT